MTRTTTPERQGRTTVGHRIEEIGTGAADSRPADEMTGATGCHA